MGFFPNDKNQSRPQVPHLFKISIGMHNEAKPQVPGLPDVSDVRTVVVPSEGTCWTDCKGTEGRSNDNNAWRSRLIGGPLDMFKK